VKITKVSITSKGVRLAILKEDGKGGEEERAFKCRNSPLGVFTDAMQGLKPFVQKILKGAVAVEDEKLRITTVSLSETKDGRRGVVISGVVQVPGAHGNPLVLNTPLVTELALAGRRYDPDVAGGAITCQNRNRSSISGASCSTRRS
jgi:hypothetical protein